MSTSHHWGFCSPGCDSALLAKQSRYRGSAEPRSTLARLWRGPVRTVVWEERSAMSVSIPIGCLTGFYFLVSVDGLSVYVLHSRDRSPLESERHTSQTAIHLAHLTYIQFNYIKSRSLKLFHCVGESLGSDKAIVYHKRVGCILFGLV